MRNNCEVTSHQQIQRIQYVVEVVVEDFVAVLGVLHREVVTRTHEEEVAHHVSDHLLVQVSVINMLPVCVLKSRLNVDNMWLQYRLLTWNMMASFSSWDTGHWDPKMVSIMSRKADRWRKLGLSFLKCSMKS